MLALLSVASGKAIAHEPTSTAFYPAVHSGIHSGEFSALDLACYVPTWTATSNITATSATLTWASVSGAENYSVQYRVANGTWYYVPGSPFYTTTANLSGLSPNTNYEWRVRTNCWGGQYSEWTYPVPFTTSGAGCTAPWWLQTNYVTQNSAIFVWEEIYGAINYTVEWRIAGGTWSNLPGSPFTNNWIEVGGLQSCTTYEWRVRANCGGGMYSAWSYVTSFTTLCSSCNVPTWPTTSYVTSTSATLHWDAVAGALSYSVQIRPLNGSWSYVAGSPFTNTTITVDGLYPNTTYEWRVRANCYGGQYSNWTWPVSFTTLGGGSCMAPWELWTSNITSNSATLDWSDVSGATSYTVQYRLAGGTWYNLPGNPYYSSWTYITGLLPGTAYEWRVRSNCGYGYQSPWSYPAYFTTPGDYQCSTPTWAETFNITSTSATLQWSEVWGAQSYTVQIRPSGGTWYNVPGTPTPNTYITVYNLTPNTNYVWRVKANCGNGQYSNWTWLIAFTTPGGYCNAPQWLTTNNITQTSATLDWDPVNGAVSYVVQWRQVGGPWFDAPGGPFYNTWTTLWGLDPGTSYEWRVKSYCGYGNYSAWSYVANFTTQGGYYCSTPTWPSTLSVTSTSATVHWDAVPGALGYTVETRLYPNGTWYVVQGSPFTNTTVTIYGLLPNTTYEWRVKANCSNWQSSNWTWPIAFTTQGGNYCQPPSWLNTTNITQTSATFDWEPVAGAVSYTVQKRIAGGSWMDVPGSPFYATWVNVTGLLPGTAYEWRVKTNCTNYWSDWSYIAYFVTLGSGGGGNNDNCSGALWLSVNNTCIPTSASNINATPSTPAPYGPCYAGGYKDVWFKFTMPGGSNPEVTIRTTAGSLTDAVMEVYSGSTCTNLTYITCEDDNNNGNGSTMPVINLNGWAGATIWVRVWGYNGTSGTFNICVFNYWSANYQGSDPSDETTFEGESISPVPGLIIQALNTDDDTPVMPALDLRPNPADDRVRVTVQAPANTQINSMILTDLSGKRVWTRSYAQATADQFMEEIDVSGLPEGVYITQVSTSDGPLTGKLIVAH